MQLTKEKLLDAHCQLMQLLQQDQASDVHLENSLLVIDPEVALKELIPGFHFVQTFEIILRLAALKSFIFSVLLTFGFNTKFSLRVETT